MAANLPPGLTLAVNTHLEFCSVCAIAAQAVAGLVEAPPEGARRRGKREPALLPMPLRGVAHGPWRWIGYGVRAAELRGVSSLGEEVWLLKAGTGARLPFGGERGVGAVVVLEGGFSDGADTFEAGDYIGLDERRLLRPVSGQGCLALVVSDGGMAGLPVAARHPDPGPPAPAAQAGIRRARRSVRRCPPGGRVEAGRRRRTSLRGVAGPEGGAGFGSRGRC